MNLFHLLGRPDPEHSHRKDNDDVAFDLDAFEPGDVPIAETEQNRALLDALRQVIDPEVGINIVDLGLVYAVERHRDRVDVVLTMTTPVCPLATVIEQDAKEALVDLLDDVDEVRLAVIFNPPWRPQMMSDAVRRRLDG